MEDLQSIVLGFLFLVFSIKFYVALRQLRSYSNTTPRPELAAIVSKEEFAKAQAYGYDKLSFGLKKDVLDFMIEVVIITCQLLAYVWSILGSYFDNDLYRSLALALVLMVIDRIQSIPFELYSIFVIEEKHGFNKQTISLFIKDQIKSFLLTIVIGGPILAGLLKIIEWGGEYFYIYVWAFLTTVILIFSAFLHDLIAPLFNTFTPLEEGSLRAKIQSLAERLKFPLTQIFVVDGSKRSEHSNAYFFGFWKKKRIVLFDTLLKQEKGVSEDEIVAVVSHELGHWYHNHFLRNIVILQISLLAQFYLFGQVMYNQTLYSAFGFEKQSIFIGLVLFGHLYTPVNFVLSLLTVKLSRYHEFQADSFAKKLDYASLLKSGLIKLLTKNASNMDPDPVFSSFYFSHPPLLERISKL
jgi:STE24 endopeptidase